ncbi:inositol monophosphatase family protein [Actinomyces minihominis]|uniref:inositol monophosphatase family protein n=1 Tax=Actinomyces minihominis TaxID=2002838 RepID=UPI0013EC8264|nr:inositol monophosphatase [Actinomyces minihominis]
MTENNSKPVSIPTALAEVATAATLAVAPYLRRVARSSPEVDLKVDIHDPVTVHDQRVEGAIRELLEEITPGSRVLGEEMGEQIDFSLMQNLPEAPLASAVAISEQVREVVADLGDRVRWIVDPIDGTANFASGLTYFATSIGVELDGKMVAGAVSAPFTYEVFVGDDTEVWHLNEHTGERVPLRSVGPSTEAAALIASYYPGVFSLDLNPDMVRAHEVELMSTYGTLRRPGAGALDLAMVAAGWIGVSMAISFKPWDVAAGIHLVRVAGGHVLNLPVDTDLPDGLRPAVVASVGNLDAVTAKRILREVEAALLRRDNR